MSPLITKVCSLYQKLAVPAFDLLQAPLLLFFRLYWFVPLIRNGWGKLNNHARVAEFFASLGIPAPELNAYFIGCLECFGGIAVALGILSRPIAFLMVCNFTVALWTAEREKVEAFFSDQKTFLQADATLYWLAALVILAFGPGKLSVDALLARRLGSRAPAPAPAAS